MIEVNNKLSIQQVVKVTDNKTNEESYLILDNTNNIWKKITKKEYDKLRGQ